MLHFQTFSVWKSYGFDSGGDFTVLAQFWVKCGIGGLMSSKADFIVPAVAGDAQQQNSIPIISRFRQEHSSASASGDSVRRWELQDPAQVMG
jgi:hypothetical protein